MRTFSVTVLLALFLVSGCLKSNDTSCDYDACALKAPDAEIAAVKSYIDSMGITATQHCSGLFYKIETPGTGATPDACDYVGVTYKGMFTNGAVFDSSSTGIALSLSKVIRGWTNGVPLLKEGGKITLYIPPSLGYGSQNYQTIPGNSILIFDISLLKVY